MRTIFMLLTIFILLTLACDLSVNIVPTDEVPTVEFTPVPVIDPPTQTPESLDSPTPVVDATSLPTETLPANDGVQVFYRPLSLVLPMGLASGISAEQFSRNEGSEVAPWDVTPGHIQINLEGYLLQGKFHQPKIYVYPATSYAEMYTGAFESVRRLDNILYSPDAPNLSEPLPAVPFFIAQQVFASNIQAISFLDGGGVRFLTEYAQYPASVNNHDLFYNFQGLTRDGNYYIIAILPITAPVLAETSDGGAVIPPGGVPYPDITSPNPDIQNYYASVSDLLDSLPPDAFSPTLSKLDALIQSIQVIP